ncbi:three-helix bundle dimerization domain-containing protein [Smaragdicoccus niigatensis]|uniref:three-helix bundle dimerization domain-containing protein n=1 Tax=Smaragdicoccus niigatensis TaxID=359359 RepID=UPI0003768F56|nr:hypothetical protein [Smaragdicoccus niigatensis]
MVSNEERRSIADLIERLTQIHPELGREKITEVVTMAYGTFDSARIRDFVPLFVERRVHRVLGEHDDVMPASFA